MQFDPLEIERLLDASTRQDEPDRVAVAWVEAAVLAAMAAYFVVAALAWALR